MRSRAHFASFRNCSLHEKGRAAIHHWALLLLPRANADSYLTGHAPALTPFTVMVPIQSRRASAVLATLPPPPPSLVCRRIQSTHWHCNSTFLADQLSTIIAIKITVVCVLFTLSARCIYIHTFREKHGACVLRGRYPPCCVLWIDALDFFLAATGKSFLRTTYSQRVNSAMKEGELNWIAIIC